MKKEEIIKKYLETTESNEKFNHFFAYNQAMQEYSDLQNKELIDKVKELENELERTRNENKRMEQDFLETVCVINRLREVQTEDIKQLQSELTELKEKHKRDVVEAYEAGLVEAFSSPESGEEYYKQTHENKQHG